MQPSTRSALRQVGMVMIACWAGFNVLWLAFTTPEYRAFVSRFPAVRTGMTGARVVELLGDPDWRGEHFELRQEAGYESEYARGRISGAVVWLTWNVGIDQTYAVGLDDEGRVCMTSRGGT